jgi:ubiquinone/menaquinone biosynthesis C-methylase UbiE
MPASPTATPEHIRDVNERYHGCAADSYDAKWGIDFGEVGRAQTRQKLVKALGELPETPFERALEIGCGTGYFSLNLMQEGVISNLVATDVSTGMLTSLSKTAATLGLGDRVETRQADAEELPFENESFDLVLGHAVLHHIPDLAKAFSEFNRVLRPGGAVVFCGEPSAYGDRLASVPKRIGAASAPAWRTLMRARPAQDNGAHKHPHDGHGLESEVDVHAFDPAALRDWMGEQGFDDIRVQGEELLANMYGWILRSLESSADPEDVPMLWRRFAFRSYIALQKLDVALLEPRLPAQLFYNLVLSARKPA